MLINLDAIAINSIVKIGGDLYKKVSPMLCAALKDGSLLYDARLIPEFKNDEPPYVEYVQ